MSRRPFYGSGAGTPIAKMDMQSATAPGRFYASALQNFGTAVASGIEKFRANKEKKENQANMENMLIAQGIDAELAKPLSKDPQAFGNYMALEKFGQQKKYQDRAGDQADRRIGMENERLHIAKNEDVRKQSQIEAQEKIARGFMESDVAEKKFGKPFVDLMRNHPAKGSGNFYSQAYAFGSRANPKGGVLDRFAETYEGKLDDIFSEDEKLRKKALAGFLGADPSMNELSSFVELAKSATNQDGFQFDPSKVTPIPGFDASFVPTSKGGGQILQKNTGGGKTTADIMNSKYAQDLIQQARGGDAQAKEELTQYFFKNFKSQDIEGIPILPEPIQEILDTL
jgi:hypothetical protein